MSVMSEAGHNSLVAVVTFIFCAILFSALIFLIIKFVLPAIDIKGFITRNLLKAFE